MRFYNYFMLGVLVCSGFGTTLTAQTKKGLKWLDKKQYEKAIPAFEADLGNVDEKACAEYGLSQVYFAADYEGRDFHKAYTLIDQALVSSQKPSPKLRENLNDRGMGLMTLRKHKQNIITAALDSAIRVKTSDAINQFLDFYKELTPPQQKKAQENRNARAFEETQKNGQAATYDKFWALYRKSCEQYNPAIAKAAEKEMFEVHMRQNSWGSFPIFANQYPDNIYVKDSAAAIKIQVAVRKNDAEAYKKFILAYPQSVFVPIAVDSLYACTLREQNIEEYDYFVRTYPKYAKIDALWTAFYKEFCKSNSCPAEFQKAYPSAPKTLYK